MTAILLATLQLAAFTLLGWMAVRMKWLGERGAMWLVKLQVWFLVPMMISTSVIQEFDIEERSMILLIPKWGLVTLYYGAIGTLGVWTALRLMGRRLRENQTILAITIISNAMFIPIPILMALLPPEQEREAILNVSIYLIYFQLTMWTAGVIWVGSRIDSYWDMFKRMLNPPLLSLVASYVLVSIIPVREFLNPEAPFWEWIGRPSRLAVGPLGMVILGSLFAHHPPVWRGHRLDIGIVLVMRGLVVPATTLTLLVWIDPPALFGLVVMVEASTPPATNLSLVAAYFRGPMKRITSTYLPSYALTVLTIPLWVGLYIYLTGFGN